MQSEPILANLPLKTRLIIALRPGEYEKNDRMTLNGSLQIQKASYGICGFYSLFHRVYAYTMVYTSPAARAIESGKIITKLLRVRPAVETHALRANNVTDQELTEFLLETPEADVKVFVTHQQNVIRFPRIAGQILGEKWPDCPAARIRPAQGCFINCQTKEWGYF